MTLSIQQFVQVLGQSGLMAANEVTSFVRQHQITDGNTLAMELVNAGRLTPFQVDLLSQGKTHELVFGEYVVVDKIGAGGMGKVYKGWHRRMERFAAIKVLSEGVLDTPGAVERFFQEVKAAARLHHPNIVTAYDSGEREGTHYLVMEHVDGKNLAEILEDRGSMPLQHALQCIIQAAKGLAYAHVHGIVHRDIKASNLILDKEGQIKILDMGLALLTETGAEKHPNGERLTTYGQIMGTAEYMAPEQAESARDIDHRADVYSLGCTLYRLLTGKPVYQGSTVIDVILAHREHAIPTLSESGVQVPEIVDAVYQKMIAKEPGSRYQSMNEVVAALQSCLSSDGDADWFQEYAGQESPGSPLPAYNLEEAETRPPAPANNPVANSATDAIATIPPKKSSLPITIDLHSSEEGQPINTMPFGRSPSKRSMVLIGLLSATGLMLAFGIAGLIWLLGGKGNSANNQTQNPPGETGPKSAESPGQVYVYKGHLASVNGVALSKNGTRMLSGGSDTVLFLWDIVSGKKIKELKGHAKAIRALDISPDGRFAVSGGFEERVKYWDLQTGNIVREFDGHGGIVFGAAFAPDGKRIATVGMDGKLRVWDVAAGKKLHEFQAHSSWVRAGAFSPDGNRLVTGGNDGLANIWDAGTGQRIITLRGHAREVNCVAFSPDGRQVVTGSFDKTARLWDAESGRELQTFLGHTGTIAAAIFAPDGKHVLSTSQDGTARIWQAGNGQQAHVFKKQNGLVGGIACTPDGRYAVTAGADSLIRLWRLPLKGMPGMPDFFQR